MLDTRTAQNDIERALKNAVLFALGARLSPVASVAALRAVPTRGQSGTQRSDDDLIAIVVGGVATASYRWSSASTAADDGAAVVKPTDVTGNGRWLRWTSPLRFAPTVGGNSYLLHELTAPGILRAVLLLDKELTLEQLEVLTSSRTPAVVITAMDDDPEDLTLTAGHLWDATYTFELTVITENLRPDREAAMGSSLDAGGDGIGANAIDGFLKALLSGTQLAKALDGVRVVRPRRGHNWLSEYMQRLVLRSRVFEIVVTEENPAAPNDSSPIEQLDVQHQLASLGDKKSLDMNNHVTSGLTVSEGVGLTKTIAAGSAVIAGAAVSAVQVLKTFTAKKDTYRDLLPNGTWAFVEVDVGGVEPAVTATALRVGVTRTDASSVIVDRLIAPSLVDYGPVQTVIPSS